MFLEVANVVIEIEADSIPLLFRSFLPFLSENPKEVDIHIKLEPVEELNLPPGKVVLDDVNTWILHGTKRHASTVYRCMPNVSGNAKPIYTVDADCYWRDATVSYLEKNIYVDAEVASLVGHILLKNRLAFLDGLIVHSSAVIWNDKGILFTAPSGTGKSTQARMWEKHLNATIINDDTPVLRNYSDTSVVYGTPWSGSGGVSENASADLAAIFIIEQGARNEISQLAPSVALPRLLPRCFMPYHDTAMMDRACRILHNIAISTPVYHFKCRPDHHAVEAAARCIS